MTRLRLTLQCKIWGLLQESYGTYCFTAEQNHGIKRIYNAIVYIERGYQDADRSESFTERSIWTLLERTHTQQRSGSRERQNTMNYSTALWRIMHISDRQEIHSGPRLLEIDYVK